MENTELKQGDLLVDEENPFFEYNKASQLQRFLNLLIDNIIIRIALVYVTSLAVGYIIGSLSPEFIDYLLYYTLFEGIFKGRTIGKFITGTKAINENGIELTFKDAFLRSACRLIPFETFSGFGTPWHDSVTNTIVIKSR